MKKIAFFCIPAHGHTNPMLPVAAELVKRGSAVRFYSFNEFEQKILSTGAEFVSCDKYLPAITQAEEEKLKNVNTTEMTLQDIRITIGMNDFMEKEFADFHPDVVYTDSVCFWGKLNAWKHKVPMVCSTSTFAFNQLSSQYMKYSLGEMKEMIFGLPKISKELKKLKPYGYQVESTLSLLQNDNSTDTVVYTSRDLQPCAASFSDHYAFVGPSVFSDLTPNKQKERPLVYISLGTVINDRPDFYHKCIQALSNMNADVIISCGRYMDKSLLGELPANVQAFAYVDQLEVLSRADVFITHCGMNSVSESIYMAAPMILYPQTNEQRAVARRVEEKGAGLLLRDDSAKGIRKAVEKALNDSRYTVAANECCRDLRSCSGAAGAADFIENAPHTSVGVDPLVQLNRSSKRFRLCYWILAIALIILFAVLVSRNYAWIIGLAAGILAYPIGNVFQKIKFKSICKKSKRQNR